MIKFDNVSKRYAGGHEALSAISFEISKGEMVFITGRSGAGKSSLLKLILAMERASTGAVFVDGVNINRLSRRQIAQHRRKIGAVFQDHQLLFDRSVFDNVALPLEICGYRPQDARRRVRAALDKVGLLRKERLYPEMLSGGEQQRVGIADKLKRYPRQLSQGERQRVAVCRAVLPQPTLLLADEPTGNLDPANKGRVLDILFEYTGRTGTTLVTVTHDHDLLDRFDRVVDFKEFQVFDEPDAGDAQ